MAYGDLFRIDDRINIGYGLCDWKGSMINIGSPLSWVRVFRLASGAVQHWWMQRLTGLALIPLSLWFLFSIISLIDTDKTLGDLATLVNFRIWIGQNFNPVLMCFFVPCVFHHAYLGLEVIIEDYVSTEQARIRFISLVKIGAILLGTLSILAVFSLVFGD